jgi:anti-sigma28 factor (negative regulator of flagellin synthesis)
MRVNDHNQTGASAEAGRAQETQRLDRGGKSRSAASGSGGDRIELSSTLTSVSRATAAHHSERSAKVRELAAAYQSGAYRPDAAATSRAMVSEALASGIH